MRVLDTKQELVGGFNPSEKYARQILSFPQVEVNHKNIFEATSSRGIAT